MPSDTPRFPPETASDLMTTRIFSVGPDEPIADALRIVTENAVRHVPVVGPAGLVGILAHADLLADPPGDARVRDVMVPPVTVEVDATLESVARLLLESGFSALPVVDGTRLVGLVSATDFVRLYVDLERPEQE